MSSYYYQGHRPESSYGPAAPALLRSIISHREHLSRLTAKVLDTNKFTCRHTQGRVHNTQQLQNDQARTAGNTDTFTCKLANNTRLAEKNLIPAT